MKKQIIIIAVIIGLVGGTGIFFFLRADISDDLEELRRTRDCLDPAGGTCGIEPAPQATSSER